MSSSVIRVLVVGTEPTITDDIESSAPIRVTVANPGAVRRWLTRTRRGGIRRGGQFDCVLCAVEGIDADIAEIIQDLGSDHPARPVIAVGDQPPGDRSIDVDEIVPKSQLAARLREFSQESRADQQSTAYAREAEREVVHSLEDGGATTTTSSAGGGAHRSDRDGSPFTNGHVDNGSNTTTSTSRAADRARSAVSDPGMVVNRVTDAIFALDAEFRFTFFNERAKEILEVEPGSTIGRSIWEVFPRILDTPVERELKRAYRSQETIGFTHHFHPEDRAYDLRLFPSETGLSVYFRDITEQRRRQRELEQLNRLHSVVSGVNEALARMPTRAEIESVVCDRLVQDTTIDFAWIGRRTGSAIEPVAYAGDIRYASALESCGGCCQQAVGNEAMETDEVVVVEPSPEEAPTSPLAELSSTVAAIPLSDGRFSHGILCVHADEHGTTLNAEGSVTALRQLRDVVGLAITAARCRAALVSDHVVEVEFTVTDAGESMIGATGHFDVAVTVPSIDLREDGTFETLARVTGEDRDRFRRGMSDHPDVHHVELGEDPETIRVTLDMDSQSVVGILASHGGRVETLEVEDGVGKASARIPERASVSTVFEDLEGTFDTVELKAKREGGRDPPVLTSNGHLAELTDRQHEALVLAFRMGYYDWPRESSAEDVAESLGVSPPTFHEHLRSAERKLLDSILST